MSVQEIMGVHTCVLTLLVHLPVPVILATFYLLIHGAV